MVENRHRMLETNIGPTQSQSTFFVDLPNFIQATRDSGYKNTAAALAEFVDNSIEAGATCVKIDVIRAADNEITIEVLDDGCGMTASQLKLALQFGGSTRFSSRRGIGRFGMGLPNAAVSQARRVELLSWQSPSAVWSAFLDVDQLSSRDSGRMELEDPLRCKHVVPASKSGTLVRLQRCDRLDIRHRAHWRLDVLTALLAADREVALPSLRNVEHECQYRGTKDEHSMWISPDQIQNQTTDMQG